MKIFASVGVDKNSIKQLNEVCYGYGIGTILSNTRVIHFAMDIMEIDGKPIARRGKRSGRKGTAFCPRCKGRLVVKSGIKKRCHGLMKPLIKTFIKKGKPVKPLPSINKIKNNLLSGLRKLRSVP